MDSRSKAEAIEQLRSKIRGLERTAIERRTHSFVATPFAALNALLPGGGLPLAALIELLSDDGIGVFSLALRLAAPVIERKAAWAVVDAEGSFYPPAAAQLELDIASLAVVRVAAGHAHWAFNQLLRCPDIGASFLISRSLDNMTYRRLQLAAERGGGVGFILRPASAIRRPCWAELRLQAAANANEGGQARRLRVTLLHARGGEAGGSVLVDLETPEPVAGETEWLRVRPETPHPTLSHKGRGEATATVSGRTLSTR